MRFVSCLVGLGLVLAATPGVSAHPNHEHKLMGTVTVVDDARIEIETKDGEKASIALAAKTAYKRGEADAKASDVTVGGRVVVFYTQDENKVKSATKILLPEAK